MKPNLALLPLAAALMLAGCASQPPQMASVQDAASLQCQRDLDGDVRNYDAAYLRSGLPAVDAEGHTYGLTLRGHLAYLDCMDNKGPQLAEGTN